MSNIMEIDHNNQFPQYYIATKPDYQNCFSYYEQSKIHFNDLPYEMIIEIFSYLSLDDLFSNVGLVCENWSVISRDPYLWMHIRADSGVSTEMLKGWLNLAPKLKTLEICNRNDAGTILDTVSRTNKELEDLRVLNCWGSYRVSTLPSKQMCYILERCPYLKNISLTGSKLLSCKFFRLLAMREHLHAKKRRLKRKPNQTVTFLGNATLKQLRMFLTARKESNLRKMTVVSVNNHQPSIIDSSKIEDSDVDNLLKDLF